MTRYLDAVKWKMRALRILVKLRGQKENNLYRVKQPSKFVDAALEKTKIKTAVLDMDLGEYEGLRHPSGCSLQFIIMCAYLLGEDGEDAWYRKMVNPYQEGLVESNYDIMAALNHARATLRKNNARF